MNFHKKDIERLRSLRRELPQKIPQNPVNNSQNERIQNGNKNKEPKVEKTPEDLFRELIEISPDGNIPKHLILELKKAEEKTSRQEIKDAITLTENNKSDNQYQSRDKAVKDQTLYSSFERLLLEEEEDL